MRKSSTSLNVSALISEGDKSIDSVNFALFITAGERFPMPRMRFTLTESGVPDKGIPCVALVVSPADKFRFGVEKVRFVVLIGVSVGRLLAPKETRDMFVSPADNTPPTTLRPSRALSRGSAEVLIVLAEDGAANWNPLAPAVVGMGWECEREPPAARLPLALCSWKDPPRDNRIWPCWRVGVAPPGFLLKFSVVLIPAGRMLCRRLDGVPPFCCEYVLLLSLFGDKKLGCEGMRCLNGTVMDGFVNEILDRTGE